MLVADRPSQLGDGLRDERRGRPIAGAAAYAIQEIAQHLGAARRVHDLGVELHAEAVASVAHRRERQPLGARDGVESGRETLHGVAVAHPRALVVGETFEQAAGLGDVDGRRTVLALAFGRDLAAEHLRHQMHAVADAEDRETPVEDGRLDLWRVRVVHARWSAGEDHTHDPTTLELLRGDVVREDLAVHA